MNIVTEIKEWQAIRNQLSDQTIGFVPTMGNLHGGHISLCLKSKLENNITVASIFVNPTQFNQTQDFELYPRTLKQDKTLLKSNHIDYLLLFSPKSLYADQYQIQITETELSQILEGKYRPGHFIGMLTVVLKFLNLVQSTSAYFGEKDYQQFLLIRKMAESLFLKTKIIACPTIRDKDGLALSSRNSRLNAEKRERAVYFPKILQSQYTIEKIINQLIRYNFKVDYIADQWQRRLGAVWLDEIRLIDNFPKLPLSRK